MFFPFRYLCLGDCDYFHDYICLFFFFLSFFNQLIIFLCVRIFFVYVSEILGGADILFRLLPRLFHATIQIKYKYTVRNYW